MRAMLDLVLLDIGGTLVDAAPPGTAVADLEVTLRPDVLADLRRLAGTVRLAAVTDTSVMTEADVRALLAPSGVSDLLEVIVTSVDVGAAKPDPTSTLAALSRLGINAFDRVLLVGDDPVDAGAADAAAIHHVDVAGGTVGDAVDAWANRHVGQLLATTRHAIAGGLTDPDARQAATERQATLTKPPGSLGRLEDLGVSLAALAGTCPPPVPTRPAVAVFAGDHGVVASGVSAWPSEVTAQMVANFCAGGAAVNVLAAVAGAAVVVVDVGVGADLSTFGLPEATDAGAALAGQLRPGDAVRPGTLVRRAVARSTSDLSTGPAMSRLQALVALEVGIRTASDLVDAGADLVATGDMGIGNTTPAAAVVSALTGADPDTVVGRGAGADDEVLARKQAAVRAGLARVPAGADGIDVLCEVGGFEIAAIAGCILGAAARRVPVVVDGVIAVAGLLVAAQLSPGVLDAVVAGHRSVEPGASAGLAHLGLDPLLDLDLRLGEGTGAVLAIPLVVAAARLLGDMATFADLGIEP